MSEIENVLEKLEGTSVYQILVDIESAYERIETEQKIWYEKSGFLCPSGCGTCCSHFEPDLMMAEALYMGAWLLENQPQVAYQVAEEKFPFESDSCCQFFNPDSPFHCSIYGGRAFICRLFGANSSKSKDGMKVWKPCRFYPQELLSARKTPLEHRQYTEEEVMNIFGIIPPDMSDLVSSCVSSDQNAGHTQLIRDILPRVISHLMWIIDMNDNGNDHPNGNAA